MSIYVKRFAVWGSVKEYIEHRKQPLFRERNIYWSYFGENIGVELCGKSDFFLRPVLILRKFNSAHCLVAPLSRQLKEGDWFVNFNYQGKATRVLLNQIKVMSTKRLQRRIGDLPVAVFIEIKHKLRLLLR